MHIFERLPEARSRVVERWKQQHRRVAHCAAHVVHGGVAQDALVPNLLIWVAKLLPFVGGQRQRGVLQRTSRIEERDRAQSRRSLSVPG